MAARPSVAAFELAAAPEAALRVERVEDAAAAEWDAYVSAHAEASAYHSYAWRTVVRKVFGHETHYLCVRDQDGLQGVLPLVRLKSALFGDFMVSLPYFNYGGVLATHARAREALLQSTADLARSLGVSHVELRHRSAQQSQWPARTDKVAMLLNLPAAGEPIDKILPSKLRSQVKRPVREGAQCVFGSLDLLDEFYAVFAENMRDLGTPVYAKSFFRTILQTFPERTWIAIVRLHNAPVAAALLLDHRDTVEIPWASSLQRVNKLGVNMFLYWNVLQRAASRGCRVFDFGRSTLDGGTFRFKRQWGAQPLQLHWHYWLAAGGELPRMNPDNPKYRLAVAAWRKLPLAAANWLGPHIVGKLP
jgi:serine/alanine adding enzyme